MTTNVLQLVFTISAAGGNVDAVNAVLKHYEGYISMLAIKVRRLIRNEIKVNTGKPGKNSTTTA